MLAAAAAALLAAGAAHAQDDGPRPERGAGAKASGKITLAEFQADRVRWFMRMDMDHDGKVSRAEFDEAMPPRDHSHGGRGGGGHGSGDMFARMDLNRDGFVTADEVEKAAAERFAEIDVANRGYITRDEMMAARGHGQRPAE